MKRTQIKKRPLSDTTLASLKSDLQEYREHDGHGLYFRVMPNGKKSWQLRYKKADGKWSWLSIGAYPQLSGQLARQKAMVLRNQINQQVAITKLSGQKCIKINQQKENNTFEHIANEWLSGKANKWTNGTMIRHCGALQNHVFPVMGKRHYQEIKPMEWLNFFKTIQAEKKIIEQSNRIYRLCRDIYDLAKVTERIDYNPLEGIHKHIAKARSESLVHISTHELPALLHAIRNYPEPEIAIALQLLVMLFPRPSELRLAKWEQFDLDHANVWIRPPEYMKKRIEHAIPLPYQAITLLKTLKKYSAHSSYLFPSCINPDRPRSDKVFINALKRMGYAGKQTPHGFRHIASTILNNQFDDREQVVEACLAHLKTGVKGAYDKGSHFNARITIMQWYANYLDEILISVN